MKEQHIAAITIGLDATATILRVKQFDSSYCHFTPPFFGDR